MSTAPWETAPAVKAEITRFVEDAEDGKIGDWREAINALLAVVDAARLAAPVSAHSAETEARWQHYLSGARMTADTPAVPPVWTPAQTLRADATDEQFNARYAKVLFASDEPDYGVALKLAREFAAACVAASREAPPPSDLIERARNMARYFGKEALTDDQRWMASEFCKELDSVLAARPSWDAPPTEDRRYKDAIDYIENGTMPPERREALRYLASCASLGGDAPGATPEAWALIARESGKVLKVQLDEPAYASTVVDDLVTVDVVPLYRSASRPSTLSASDREWLEQAIVRHDYQAKEEREWESRDDAERHENEAARYRRILAACERPAGEPTAWRDDPSVMALRDEVFTAAINNTGIDDAVDAFGDAVQSLARSAPAPDLFRAMNLPPTPFPSLPPTVPSAPEVTEGAEQVLEKLTRAQRLLMRMRMYLIAPSENAMTALRLGDNEWMPFLKEIEDTWDGLASIHPNAALQVRAPQQGSKDG